MSSPAQYLRHIGALSIATAVLLIALPARSDTPIAVEGTPNDTSGTLYYAIDMGFFRKAGLDVSLTSLNNPGAAVAAIAGGSIAIGGLPISVAAVAREKGLPLVLIAPAGVYVSTSPTAAIIVLNNSPVHTAHDLNGKTLASRDLSNMSYFAANLWIDKHGGDSSTVHWVEINDPLDVGAMQAGRIDAASVSEPALDAALHGGAARSVGPVFDAIANRFLIGGYFTSEAYAKANPDVIRRFVDAIAATSAWANKNQALSAPILAKYANAPVLPGSTRVTYDEHLSAADVQPILDVLLKSGQLHQPIRAQDFFWPPQP
jgi:NitT/TauT family transport system substrate-binding protein